MKPIGVEAIARAVLYEGYALYPYRGSSLKNRQRWMFGTVYPKAWAQHHGEGDAWWTQTECLVRVNSETQVELQLRFLQMQGTGSQEREVVVPRCRASDWLEALDSREISFHFAAGTETEAIFGRMTVGAVQVAAEVLRLSLRIENTTPAAHDWTRSAALLRSFGSVHSLWQVTSGEFISLADPPPGLRKPADQCRNIGCWPALVGDPQRRDTLLSSPIILSDFPRVAPESRGELFDSTEIDEILTLRILTLTDEEKREACASDPRVRALVERIETSGPEGLTGLHGARREVEAPLKVSHPRTQAQLGPGDRVRLCPARGGDVFDLALAGKVATIEAVQVDFEDRVHLAVTVDEDPGKDLGRAGHPGHRFFFHLHEVEPL